MLPAKMLPLMTVLFLVSFASGERDRSRVLRSRDDRPTSRKAAPQEYYYFEQCNSVNVWSRQLGHVSVLAFLDLSWQYSIRQAVMLRLLSSRLRKSGFPGIRFFAIIPPLDLDEEEDGTEDDVEIEAWGIARTSEETTRDLPDVDDRPPPQDAAEPEMIFLQDDARSRIWRRFRASKDQVVVIDRCGRLTYQVIIPWSILYFPYVKAAILSTYADDPCGGCDPTVYEAYFSGAVNNTDKDADPSVTDDDVDADLIWKTTDAAGNLTTDGLDGSSERNREANTVPAVALESATDSTGDAREVSSAAGSTESAYQYDNATESPVDEGNADAAGTRAREETTTRSASSATDATNFEPQQNVPSKEEEETAYMRTPADDVTPGYTEIENDSISAATTSGAAADDGTRENGGNANVDSDGPNTRERNESVDVNAASKEGTDRLEQDPLPLRIIMQAPHLHGSGRKTKKHTHLILRVGDPNFHGHLSSEVDVRQPTNSRQDISIETKSTEEQEAVETDKEDAHQTYTFDIDESPGLYGEVADYWKIQEDKDIIDENKSYKSTIKYNEETREDKTVSPESTGVNKQEEEMEMRNKLIKHYNKLLSWISYRLNK